MTRLDGKICLIAGGTGTVGEAVVKVFLGLGATVVVPSRTRAKLDGLRAYLGELPAAVQERLTFIEGNLGEPSGARRIREEILARHGTLNAVVSSLGGSFEERQTVMEIPLGTFREYQDSNLNSHILAAQTFLPLLTQQPGSSYTLLGGLSAVLTMTRYSPVSLPSAAQLMLAKVLMEELKGTHVRINQAMFGYIHTRARASYAQPEWVTAEEVGEFLAYLASDAARMINGGILQFGDRPARSTTA